MIELCCSQPTNQIETRQDDDGAGQQAEDRHGSVLFGPGAARVLSALSLVSHLLEHLLVYRAAPVRPPVRTAAAKQPRTSHRGAAALRSAVACASRMVRCDRCRRGSRNSKSSQEGSRTCACIAAQVLAAQRVAFASQPQLPAKLPRKRGVASQPLRQDHHGQRLVHRLHRGWRARGLRPHLDAVDDHVLRRVHLRVGQ